MYKYQGAEIEEEYNIYDVDKMDFKMLYTVLSRVKTSFKNIHLDHKSLKKKYTARKKPRLELCYYMWRFTEVTASTYTVYRHARAEISWQTEWQNTKPTQRAQFTSIASRGHEIS